MLNKIKFLFIVFILISFSCDKTPEENNYIPLTLVADEFGYAVEFVTAEIEESIQEQEDKPEDLLSRPPIVTVMGHLMKNQSLFMYLVLTLHLFPLILSLF